MRPAFCFLHSICFLQVISLCLETDQPGVRMRLRVLLEDEQRELATSNECLRFAELPCVVLPPLKEDGLRACGGATVSAVGSANLHYCARQANVSTAWPGPMCRHGRPRLILLHRCCQASSPDLCCPPDESSHVDTESRYIIEALVDSFDASSLLAVREQTPAPRACAPSLAMPATAPVLAPTLCP